MAPAKKIDDVIIEDARLIFRNLAGRAQQYNSEGDRNFCVLLDKRMAEKMAKDGWNVKYLKPREEGEEPQAYIQVAVNYNKGRPPRVVLITSRGRVDLGAEEVEVVDYADIKTADVKLNPYVWEVNGNTGVKAYLKSMFVTLNEDELDLKYADINRAADNDTVYSEEED